MTDLLRCRRTTDAPSVIGSEPFWRVKLRDGKAETFGLALKRIRESVEYVEINDALATLLRQPETNRLLRDVLLGQLFEIL